MPTHHELSVSDQEQASFWLVKKYNQQIYQELPTFLSFHLKLSRCSGGPNEMSWLLWILRKFYPWKSWLPSVMCRIPRPKSTCSTRQTRGKIMDWTFERLEILEKMAWRRVALNFLQSSIMMIVLGTNFLVSWISMWISLISPHWSRWRDRCSLRFEITQVQGDTRIKVNPRRGSGRLGDRGEEEPRRSRRRRTRPKDEIVSGMAWGGRFCGKLANVFFVFS